MQPASSIACFLRHLWATDGCVHLSKGKINSVKVYYATSSPELACNIQSLLLRLGLNASVLRYEQKGKGRDQYHVKVSGKADVETFFENIGVLGQKKIDHQSAINEYFASSIAKTNRDVLPVDLWNAALINEAGHSKTSRKVQHQNLSRERAASIASSTRSLELMKLAQSDVYWDEIISIESDGEAEVYDLTVEGLHNFIAADIVAHNSIEQDSDIVMFIYRDDVYNPESERKNIADVIIAKHRNGPVGEISLYFQASQTRFRDLELNPPAE